MADTPGGTVIGRGTGGCGAAAVVAFFDTDELTGAGGTTNVDCLPGNESSVGGFEFGGSTRVVRICVGKVAWRDAEVLGVMLGVVVEVDTRAFLVGLWSSAASSEAAGIVLFFCLDADFTLGAGAIEEVPVPVPLPPVRAFGALDGVCDCDSNADGGGVGRLLFGLDFGMGFVGRKVSVLLGAEGPSVGGRLFADNCICNGISISSPSSSSSSSLRSMVAGIVLDLFLSLVVDMGAITVVVMSSSSARSSRSRSSSSSWRLFLPLLEFKDGLGVA